MLPTPNPNVIYRAMGDGAVLFSTADEVYFGLNTVGARVWSLLPPTCDTLDALCVELGRAYPDVDSAVLRADAADLLDELVANRLAVPPGGAADAEPAPRSPDDQTADDPDSAAQADVADPKRVG